MRIRGGLCFCVFVFVIFLCAWEDIALACTLAQVSSRRG